MRLSIIMAPKTDRYNLNPELLLKFIKQAKAQAAGKPGNWWAGKFKFDPATKAGNATTTWIPLSLCGTGGWKTFTIRAGDELSVGTVKQETAAGAAAAATGSDKDYGPKFTIRKWLTSPATVNKDGVTLVTGADGKPVLPPEDQLCVLYQALEAISEVYAGEAKAYLARGAELRTLAETGRLDEAIARMDPAKPDTLNGAFIAKADLTVIRRSFGAKYDTIAKHVFPLQATTVFTMLNEYNSDKAPKFPGAAKANPRAYVAIPVKNKQLNCSLVELGKDEKYEMVKIDGAPVSIENINKLPIVLKFTAVITLELTLSAFGISMKPKIPHGSEVRISRSAGSSFSVDEEISAGFGDAAESGVSLDDTVGSF